MEYHNKPMHRDPLFYGFCLVGAMALATGLFSCAKNEEPKKPSMRGYSLETANGDTASRTTIIDYRDDDIADEVIVGEPGPLQFSSVKLHLLRKGAEPRFPYESTEMTPDEQIWADRKLQMIKDANKDPDTDMQLP